MMLIKAIRIDRFLSLNVLEAVFVADMMILYESDVLGCI